MEKLLIKNRREEKVSVLIEYPDGESKGVAFIMHGLGGIKERPHLETFASAFLNNGYIAVRFDATNTFGESDGSYENATTTNFREDLEDVIAWAKTQSWYSEPFCLAGHSLGGIATALYAQKHPDMVKGLAPISTVVSGALMIEADKEYRPEAIAEWDRKGWRTVPNASVPTGFSRLRWEEFKSDVLRYDLLKESASLVMPILLIVGENDDVTPPKHQQLFFDAISHNKKELHVIKGAPHTFNAPEHLEEIRHIFDAWIKRLL
jgi:pimeloyl-ACP methyl ester carboxylesterase